eukprot:scaffold188_cov336-Pavlova_lutheri.AAC.8
MVKDLLLIGGFGARGKGGALETGRSVRGGSSSQFGRGRGYSRTPAMGGGHGLVERAQERLQFFATLRRRKSVSGCAWHAPHGL